MSDLRRWSEEGATAEELSLLEVARRRRALPAQRAAVLSAIGVGAATTAAGAATGAGWVMKLVGVALLASAGAGVAYFRSESGQTAQAPASSAPVVRSVAPSARPEPSPAPQESAAVSVEPAPGEPAPSGAAARSAIKPKPVSAPAPSSALSRELQVLKQAHEALAKGNPNGALSALDDYHARFPQGTLGAEETVIRVQALLARGDRERAAAVARQFSKAHPDSLYAQRVEALVSGVK